MKNKALKYIMPAIILTLILCFACLTQIFAVDDTQFSEEIAIAAKKYNIDPLLVKAVIYQESKFNPDSVGRKGEIGLMQIMTGKSGAVAEWARVNSKIVPPDGALFNVSTNLNIGCWYLSKGLERWKNHPYQIELALCFYNAGPSRANSWSEIKDGQNFLDNITIDTTRYYVESILKRYLEYHQEEKK